MDCCCWGCKSGCAKIKNKPIVLYKKVSGHNHCGADAVRAADAPALVVAAVEHAPHVAGAAGVRGAEPPVGGASVQLRNTLVEGGAVCTRTEVRELCAIPWEQCVVADGPAQLINGQEEDFAAQAVCAGRYRASRTSTVLIRDFHLLNSVLDVIIEQIQECSVQVGVNVGVLVVVILTVPSHRDVDVLS